MDEDYLSQIPVIAAIDIGTNSIHLVIAKTDQYGHMIQQDSDKEVVRLGEALDDSGNFTEEGIERAVNAIAHMKEIAMVHQPVFRVVATHATRVARNYLDLVGRVWQKTGLRISLIDGDEEARLVSLGMQWGLPLEDKTFLGVDIGGGSTEIVVCHKDQIYYVTSVELGAVTLNKKFLKGQTFDQVRIDKIAEEIDLKLSPLHPAFKNLRFDCAVICSGAAKTMAMMHAVDSGLEKPEDANGYHLSHQDISKLSNKVKKKKDPEKIRKYWDLESTRADIILAGSMILDSLTSLLNVKEWIVSSYGVREGLVHDTLQRLHKLPLEGFSNVRWNNILRLGERFQIDSDYAHSVTSMALSLYDQICPEQKNQKYSETSGVQVSDRSMLKAAAWLHECGKFLSFTRFHKHSHYMIANSRLMGFSHRERRMIGLIARYHRKGRAGKKSYDCSDLTSDERAKINLLSGFLRIAAAANRSRQKAISTIRVERSGTGLKFVIEPSGPGKGRVEITKMTRDKALLEEQLGQGIQLELSDVL